MFHGAHLTPLDLTREVLKAYGCYFISLEPNSHINWHPRPRFLYFSCAVERKHRCCKFKPRNGIFRVPEVILHSPHPKFFSLPPVCTCVGEHLPQGASNMSLSWHPFCEFQKYKLAGVGRRLGTALEAVFHFAVWFFHSSCQESISVQKFLLFSHFSFISPPRSNCVFSDVSACFLSPTCSYTVFHLYITSLTSWILDQEWK